MKHKILVTGASGAFGSLACIQLAENGLRIPIGLTPSSDLV
ncbi:MAG: hypothetical protein R2828_01820 [Saprospiraceae bacterium]